MCVCSRYPVLRTKCDRRMAVRWWCVGRCLSLLVAVLQAVLPGVSACTGRTVLNQTTGTVTDGTGKYPPSAHCEWLIDGKYPICHFSYFCRNLFFFAGISVIN